MDVIPKRGKAIFLNENSVLINYEYLTQKALTSKVHFFNIVKDWELMHIYFLLFESVTISHTQ